MTKEIALKIIYRYLAESFRDGQKVNRFDAEASEYWLPRIDYEVAPNLYKELFEEDLKQIEEENK